MSIQGRPGERKREFWGQRSWRNGGLLGQARVSFKRLGVIAGPALWFRVGQRAGVGLALTGQAFTPEAVEQVVAVGLVQAWS